MTEARSRDGETPLIFAVDSGDCETVAYLLSTGASPNSQDNFGRPPLFHALEIPGLRRYDIVAELLRGGADVNLTDNQGRTALSLANRLKLEIGRDTFIVRWWPFQRVARAIRAASRAAAKPSA